MALEFPDTHFQTEGNLHPEGGINIVSGMHVWAFPDDDENRIFPYINNYTDSAQDFDCFTF